MTKITRFTLISWTMLNDKCRRPTWYRICCMCSEEREHLYSTFNPSALANNARENWMEGKSEFLCVINPLDPKGNYSATSNDTKSVHWPLMGGLLYLVQPGGTWAGCGSAQFLSRCTNVTAHPSTCCQCTNHRIAMVRYSAVLMWWLKGQHEVQAAALRDVLLFICLSVCWFVRSSSETLRGGGDLSCRPIDAC